MLFPRLFGEMFVMQIKSFYRSRRLFLCRGLFFAGRWIFIFAGGQEQVCDA